MRKTLERMAGRIRLDRFVAAIRDEHSINKLQPVNGMVSMIAAKYLMRILGTWRHFESTAWPDVTSMPALRRPEPIAAGHDVDQI